MNDIIVKSQAEFDAIPVDYNGRIYIEFGTPFNRAVVNRKFKYARVVARGNSSVEAWENSSVEAWENSSVVAMENSRVVARGNSGVVARENSSIVAWGYSSVEAWGYSSVVAMDNSRVEAWENSRIVAWGNSSVVASGNSQICDNTRSHNISVTGNSRIVYNPRNIDEYCEHFQIERTETAVKLYKAVHKKDGRFFADHDGRFEYVVGEIAVADRLDTNTNEDCGHGIHMAHKAWCVDYGRNWDDLAIIEVEADADGIVVPVPGCGKVRAAQVKVLREVPLEECGLLGKMLAKKDIPWKNNEA